jgi:hypothetical protein
MLEVKRPYDLRRWRKIAKQQLQDHPLCAMCLQLGEVVPAVIVDHVEPHKRDPIKFWLGAVQSLCSHHHGATKQQLEIRGYNTDIGVDGWPKDTKHPVYQTQKRK